MLRSGASCRMEMTVVALSEDVFLLWTRRVSSLLRASPVDVVFSLS